MSYHFDIYDSSLVIDGWEQGIAPDPYEGTANLQNVNITSIPGEASVGFSTTASMLAPTYSNVVVGATGDAATVTLQNNLVPNLEVGQGLYFSASNITGLTAGTTVYWVSTVDHTAGGGSLCKIGFTSTYNGGNVLTIGNGGTAAFYVYSLDLTAYAMASGGVRGKKYMVASDNDKYHWLLDSNGLVWSDIVKTSGGTGLTATNSWTYTGNQGNAGYTPDLSANGNGMVYWRTSSGTSYPGKLDGWIFVWRNGAIDYLQVEAQSVAIAASSLTWVYGWDPSAAATGHANYLQYSNNVSHEAIVVPDGAVCYCDGYQIGRFYQSNIANAFVPTTSSTYTFNNFSILQANDIAQSLSFIGTLVLIGGSQNVIYPWNEFTNDQKASTPYILLPETNVTSIVTVGMKAYIFCGNRGRIYVTNGSQADLWKKIPDHISGVVQPTFTWTTATYTLNTLYFGFFATENGNSTNLVSYKGIWAADVTTGAIYNSNSFNSSFNYNVGLYAAALLPIKINGNTSFSGYGVYAAWGGGTTLIAGIETPSSTLYEDGSSIIETEIVPLGTYNIPRNPTYMEYKLVKPLLSGDKIQVQYRSDFSQNYSTIFTDSTAGNFSNTFPTTFDNSQWAQFKILLTAGTTTSYVRLKEIRVAGMSGPTLAQAPELGT